MIHEFTGRGRIFWFPKAWANSVARWICGVFSPSGTIQVTNNLSPDGEGSLALDVNVNAVAKQIAEMRDDREITQGRIESMKHIVRGMLDGNSLKSDGEHIHVDADWVAKIAAQTANDSSADTSTPTDRTDTNADDGTDAGTPWSWTSGTNRLKFDCYCEIEKNDNLGIHYLRRCTLTFDKSGRLTSAALCSGHKILYV